MSETDKQNNKPETNKNKDKYTNENRSKQGDG